MAATPRWPPSWFCPHPKHPPRPTICLVFTVPGRWRAWPAAVFVIVSWAGSGRNDALVALAVICPGGDLEGVRSGRDWLAEGSPDWWGGWLGRLDLIATCARF